LGSLKLLQTQKLSNGLTVSIYDGTKVYFGDYHHVRVRIICSLDDPAVDSLSFDSDDITATPVLYTRTLEKMGVPSAEVESVIKALLKDFELNSEPYISLPDFPKKIIASELSLKKRPGRKYSGSGS
jgi:hypothetical protein